MENELIQFTDVISGKTITIKQTDKLTSDNVISKITEYLHGRELNRDTLMMLSFYMAFAIHTKDLTVIRRVHDRITTYFLEV